MTGNPEVTRVMGPNLLCQLRGSPHSVTVERFGYRPKSPVRTLGISDDAGFKADFGVVELITPLTGQQHKASAASQMLFGKGRKMLTTDRSDALG